MSSGGSCSKAMAMLKRCFMPSENCPARFFPVSPRPVKTENSLGFGALGLLLIYVLDPWISGGLKALTVDAAIAIAWALIGILVVDSANSIRSLAKVRPVLDELHGTLAEAHTEIEQRAARMHETRTEQEAARRSASRSTLGRLARIFPRARSVRATATRQ